MTLRQLKPPRLACDVIGLVLAAALASCGGGDGTGGRSQVTRFQGNLVDATGTAPLQKSAHPLLVQSSVEVCVQGTDFCTVTDGNGVFTLDADVSGDVTLHFIASGFSANLSLSDVPRGATIRIEDIRCSVTTGTCVAEDVVLIGANLPPICDNAVAQPAELSPPNHELRRVDIDNVIDPDGDPVVLTVVAIFQDEPIDEPGTGNTAPDATVDPLALRAERAGTGNGRIYLVEFTADDGRDGQCMGAVTVCVPHDQGQGANCVDDGTAYDSTATTGSPSS